MNETIHRAKKRREKRLSPRSLSSLRSSPPLSLSLDTANSAKMGRFDWGTTPNEREGALRVEGLECRFGDIICVKIAPIYSQ